MLSTLDAHGRCDSPFKDVNDRHLKSYTAGEDNSRLAAMAKELGLERQRQPRNQVRRHRRRRPDDRLLTSTSTFLGVSRWVRDPTTEDARMRAIYTSHTRVDEDDLLGQRTLLERLQYSWDTQELQDNHHLEEDIKHEESEHADIEQGSNLASAVLGIIKGMVGPAILYLPHGFAGAGYAVALPILFICTCMYLHSSRCLLDAWNHELTRETNAPASELTNILQYHKTNRIILSYPELAYRALGPSGETIVKTGIALMQSGVCLTYLIFVPQNLHASMQTLAGVNIPPAIWLILMICIQIPLSWIRDIRKLTPTNFLANALILYGLLLCLAFAFSKASSTAGMTPSESLWSHLKDLDAFNGQWFLFIGTSVSDEQLNTCGHHDDACSHCVLYSGSSL
jgi:solute carrier family 36 (proton-coupled amino acid transporter)